MYVQLYSFFQQEAGHNLDDLFPCIKHYLEIFILVNKHSTYLKVNFWPEKPRLSHERNS